MRSPCSEVFIVEVMKQAEGLNQIRSSRLVDSAQLGSAQLENMIMIEWHVPLSKCLPQAAPIMNTTRDI